MEYRYKVDEKVTTWQRSHITITTESQEEADKEMIATVSDRDKWQNAEIDWSEDLIDTASQITVEDNGGDATIEVIRDNENQETIWTNK